MAMARRPHATWRAALLGPAALLLLVMLAPPALAATEHPYNRGCKALARGDVDKAKTLFREAVKLDAKDTDALNNLAYCHMMLGDYDEALPLLQKVLRLNSGYRGADLNIGAVYLFRDEPGRATPPTTRARDGSKTPAGTQVKAAAFYNLGLIAARRGDFVDARAAFKRSLEIEDTPRSRMGLAYSLCAEGDFATGLPMLEGIEPDDDGTAAALKAGLAAAYYQCGMERLGDGDLAGAEDDFARSADAVENGYARMGQAIVEAERGDRAAAAALLAEVKGSAESPQLQRAATANLARLQRLADDETQWLKWLVLLAGALLFSLQTYVLVAALAASPRRDGAVVGKVALGIVVGLAAAVVLVWAFFDPFRGPLLVAAVLAIDLVVVGFVWRGTSSASRAARSA